MMTGLGQILKSSGKQKLDGGPGGQLILRGSAQSTRLKWTDVEET